MSTSTSADRPFSHHFRDRDDKTRQYLSTFLKTVLMSTIMITVVTWTVLAIYWGALWRPTQGVHNLNGWIVDFDGGPIGRTVTQALMNATGPKTEINWYTVPASEFSGGERELPDKVVNERAWVAVAIAAGASDRLNAAIAARDSAYNGSSAVTAYAAEAREENGYRNYIQPSIQRALTQASSVFAMQHVMTLGSQAGDLLSTAPTTVLMPLNYTISNVRPFDIPVATAVNFVGLIYLLILAFVAALSSYQARNMLTQLDKHLSLSRLLVLRYIVPIAVYFWLSLAYCLLSKFFLVPFDRRYGDRGFVIYWMISWFTMMALGLAVEALVPLLTVRFIPFFLILWIIVNVSVIYYPIEILPTVFRYGYATPFYNESRAVRCIVFATRCQLGLNFGVQIAWIVISLITIPFIQWYVRRKDERQYRDQEAHRKDSK